MYRKNNFQKFSEMVPLACWAYRTLWTSILFLVQQMQQVDVFTGEKKKKKLLHTSSIYREREGGGEREGESVETEKHIPYFLELSLKSVYWLSQHRHRWKRRWNLTVASSSNFPNSSFRSLTSSCAVHWEARLVKPTMSANRMLSEQKKKKKRISPEWGRNSSGLDSLA